MTNLFIRLQSECMRILEIERIEDCVHSIHENDASTRLWINANSHAFIDFELYPFLDQIQLNDQIIIDHISYTVIKVIQPDLEYSSLMFN